MTVKADPATSIVPVRGVVFGFGSTLKMTDPLPVPPPAARRIHPADAVAVQSHSSPASTETDPPPPTAVNECRGVERRGVTSQEIGDRFGAVPDVRQSRRIKMEDGPDGVGDLSLMAPVSFSRRPRVCGRTMGDSPRLAMKG